MNQTTCRCHIHTEDDIDIANAAISMRDVCFSYGNNEVLHNVTLSIPKKSIAAVVGPNGGGKTTLLRLMLGDLLPVYGKIHVTGKPPVYARRKIGFVPQQFNYDPQFPINVLETVMLGRSAKKTFGFFSEEDREAAFKALAEVGLASMAKRHFSELSGGQRQRVFVAQALCSDPEILLLDEPTANVDAKTENDLYSLFKNLNRDKTLVIVSHNLRVIASYATHIIHVNRTADMHELSKDNARMLVPLPGSNEQSLVDDNYSAHLESLTNFMNSPHNAQFCNCPNNEKEK